MLDEKKYKYELIDSHELNPKHNFYKYIPTDYNFIPKILLIDKKNITWIGGYDALVVHLSTIKKKKLSKNNKSIKLSKKVKVKSKKQKKK